jgi:dihydrofolate reductase
MPSQTRLIGAIAAMTKERVIGTDNTIPWHYSEDFKRFKRLTLNSIIIMGRKTWESIGRKALPKRRNIVISRSVVDNTEHYASIKAALADCEGSPRDIWFIGGGQIYADALPHCTHLDITTVPDHIEPADAVLFPEIDQRVWSAGKSTPLAADPRLSVQRFLRK